jgi:hypothetical protein
MPTFFCKKKKPKPWEDQGGVEEGEEEEDDESGEYFEVSSYDMNEVAKMAVKADCLGLRTLDLIEGVRKITGFKISDIDLRDPKLYDMFQNLEYPLGVFQIEAGITWFVRRLSQRHLTPYLTLWLWRGLGLWILWEITATLRAARNS